MHIDASVKLVIYFTCIMDFTKLCSTVNNVASCILYRNFLMIVFVYYKLLLPVDVYCDVLFVMIKQIKQL